MIQISLKAFLFLFILFNNNNCQIYPNNITTQIKNLIVNGNFTDNLCLIDYCVWTSQRYNNQVNGWLPLPRIQVGKAITYNSQQLSSTYVMMFRNDKCIGQKIPRIASGSLNLKIKWAGKRYVNLITPQQLMYITIYQNNILKLNLSTTDDIQKENNIVLESSGGCQILQIKICGNNTIVSYIQLIGSQILTPIINVPDQNLSGFSNPSTIINSFTPECIEKTYNLQRDFYELKFAYRAYEVSSLLKAHMIIYWNDNILQIRKPIDQSKNILRFSLNITQDINRLKFCPSVCLDDRIHHQIQIENNIIKRSCQSKKQTNLIINYGFESSTCPDRLKYCQFWSSNNDSSQISSWQNLHSLQIGNGQMYNKVMPRTLLIDLATYQDECIKQQISQLTYGNYILEFDWIARDDSNFTKNNFNITIGYKVNKTMQPKDTVYNHEVFMFYFNQSLNSTFLMFCACGNSFGGGSQIDNVKLFYLDKCAV